MAKQNAVVSESDLAAKSCCIHHCLWRANRIQSANDETSNVKCPLCHNVAKAQLSVQKRPSSQHEWKPKMAAAGVPITALDDLEQSGAWILSG